MAKKIVLMSSDTQVSRADAAAFLRQLADKLESGSVSLIQGEQEVVLEIPAQVQLEIEAEEKPKKGGAKRQLEIEIEWITGPGGEPQEKLELG